MSRKLFKSQHQGFTLLELLVTLLVIGLGVGVASLSISGTRNNELQNAARQLHAQMRLASEEAILNNQQLGLIFDVETAESDGRFSFPQYSYRWLVLASQDDKRFPGRKIYYWRELEDAQMLQNGQFPEAIELTISIEGQEILIGDHEEDDSRLNLLATALSEDDKVDEDGKPINQVDTKLRPDLFFFSSGEMLSFDLQFSDAALAQELGTTLEETQTYRFHGSMIGQLTLKLAGEADEDDK